MMRIIVGVSGASGAILAKALLAALQKLPDVETHLVVTRQAGQTLQLESGLEESDLHRLAYAVYPVENTSARIASGSFQTAGMVVIPCSMKTLSGIAHGYSENLLLRAADVCLKERRKLVLVPRETPLSVIHLENMLKAAQAGAVMIPPMLTFYHHPQTIADLIDPLVGKILLQFGLEFPEFRAWPGADLL